MKDAMRLAKDPPRAYTEGGTRMLAARWMVAALLPQVVGAVDFEAARERMVHEQILTRGVRNPEVIEALRRTPRHWFVPAALQERAYEDNPLPIGHGQTISQPYIVALMTELLDVRRSDKVLEIGTGSGYQAAVLSGLAREIYTIELVPELARAAKAVLERLHCSNVIPRQGDGYLGWPDRAPFDRIILTAAPPRIPQALVDQLAVGGKLVAPEGIAGSMSEQRIVVMEKRADGTVARKENIRVRFVPMVH